MRKIEYWSDKKRYLNMVFIDLKNSYNKVKVREVVLWSMPNKGVSNKYINIQHP